MNHAQTKAVILISGNGLIRPGIYPSTLAGQGVRPNLDGKTLIPRPTSRRGEVSSPANTGDKQAKVE